MIVLFCDSVIDPKSVEPDYENEEMAAKKAGFKTALFSYEALIEERLSLAFKFIQSQESETAAIYRGWMLTPDTYRQMYDHLLSKNIRLINNPKAYQHCHYLPDSYAIIEEYTPASVWTNDGDYRDMEKVHALLSDFGSNPVILKDYVKSEKHHWKEACFIPNPQDKATTESIIQKFLELRGDSLNQGLVFRKYVELEYLTEHSKSGMPLTKEYRLFFMNGQLLTRYDYWDEGVYEDEAPPLDVFVALAEKVESSFFTMDIAQKTDGNWIIVELGDGQVAGLPDLADRTEFYEGLRGGFS
jgi:hypothetical protein